MRGPAESTIPPAKSSRSEIASNSKATETCNETNEGLDSAAAIAFDNLLCEKKPVDWWEAQSRTPTARLVIKLLRAKTKREDIPTNELKSKDIDPDKVWRLLDQCKLTALPEYDNHKSLARRQTHEPASRPNRKPERYERLLGDEPVGVYVPLPWVMDSVKLRFYNRFIYVGVDISIYALLTGGRSWYLPV